MDASLETLVVAGYVFATSLSIPRPGPHGLIPDHELIALAVAQAITGLCSDRQFLGQIGRLLPGWFPVLPDQSQYNRRLRRLIPQITQAQMIIAELIAQDPIRLVGSLLFADKGLWGKELDASMELINVQLITPERHQLRKRPPAEIAKTRMSQAGFDGGRDLPWFRRSRLSGIRRFGC